MDPDAPKGAQGRQMMEDKLRLYLSWKGKLSEPRQGGKNMINMPDERQRDGLDQLGNAEEDGLSEALKRKDRQKKEKIANRRRVRGGTPGPVTSGSGRTTATKDERKVLVVGEEAMRDEAEDIADLWVTFFF